MTKKLTEQETMAIVRAMDGIFTDGLHGDFIPHSWYTELQFEKTNSRGEGRANLPAIIVLADICYWWRPRKVDGDEPHSGKIGKKFSKDKLHRSHRQYAVKGLTKKQAADAMSYLESRGLIEVELRDEIIKGTYYKNRKYITPVSQAIRAITYVYSEDDDIVPGSGVLPGSDTLSLGSDTLSPGSETYTKNTTQNTTKTTNMKNKKSDNNVMSNDVFLINGTKIETTENESDSQRVKSLREEKNPAPPVSVMSSDEKIVTGGIRVPKNVMNFDELCENELFQQIAPLVRLNGFGERAEERDEFHRLIIEPADSVPQFREWCIWQAENNAKGRGWRVYRKFLYHGMEIDETGCCITEKSHFHKWRSGKFVRSHEWTPPGFMTMSDDDFSDRDLRPGPEDGEFVHEFYNYVLKAVKAKKSSKKDLAMTLFFCRERYYIDDMERARQEFDEYLQWAISQNGVFPDGDPLRPVQLEQYWSYYEQWLMEGKPDNHKPFGESKGVRPLSQPLRQSEKLEEFLQKKWFDD